MEVEVDIEVEVQVEVVVEVKVVVVVIAYYIHVLPLLVVSLLFQSFHLTSGPLVRELTEFRASPIKILSPITQLHTE